MYTMKHKAASTDCTTLVPVYFCRVSSDEQTKGDSLSNQEKANREFAVARGMRVDEAITLSGDESGNLPLEDRPLIKQLRALIATKRNALAVIVKDSSRLSRKPGAAEELFDLMQAANVRFFVVKEQREYILSDMNDRFMLLISMGFNRQWSEMIWYQMYSNKAELARTHIIGHNLPKFGYDKIRNGKYNELVPNEAEAELVRQIFDWCDAGVSLRGICTKLRDVPSPGKRHGNRENGWYPTTIRRILRERAFCGEYVQTYGGETHIITVPALVSKEQWERVQERLNTNKVSTRKVFDHYALARRLRCDHCNTVITTHNHQWKSPKRTTTAHYYVCTKKQSKPANHICPLPMLRADALDAFVYDWLIDRLKNPGKLQADIEAAQAGTNIRRQALQERLAGIEATRAQHKARLKELLSTSASSATVRSMLDSFIAETDQVFNDLEAEETRINAEIAQLSGFYINFADVTMPPAGTEYDWQDEVPADAWGAGGLWQEEDASAIFARRLALIERYNITGRLEVEADGQRVIHLRIGGHTDRVPLAGGKEYQSSCTSLHKHTLLDVVAQRGITFRLLLAA